MLEFEQQMAHDTLLATAIGSAIGLVVIVGALIFMYL
jgi:hypothetical protein